MKIMFTFFIISSSISTYFIYNNHIKKEGFWCFMSHKDAFLYTLIMINGVYFVCLIITVIYNILIVKMNSNNNLNKSFKYLPLLQLLFFPIIFFGTALNFFNPTYWLERGMMIGAILSCLNGVFNALCFGFNENSRRQLVGKLGCGSGTELTLPLKSEQRKKN